MKKVYTKPEIIFEDFTLNTNIAAGCEVQTKLPSWNQCGLDLSGVMVFMSGMSACKDIAVEVDGEFDSICYHVPHDSKNLFTS